MKIWLQTFWSRWDIDPFITIWKRLHKLGHEVTLYITVFSKEFIQDTTDIPFTIKYISTPNEQQKKSIDDIHSISLSNLSKEKKKEKLKIYFDSIFSSMYPYSKKLCIENDIILWFSLYTSLKQAATETGTPYISIWLGPMDKLIGIEKNENNQGIKKTNRSMDIIATSKLFQEKKLNPWKIITWCIFRNDTGNISDTLEKFLHKTDKKILFTLWSLIQKDTNKKKLLKILSIFTHASTENNCIAVIEVPKKYILTLPIHKEIYYIDYVPHNLIMKHMDIIVHHGWAWTSQRSVIEWIPSIVIPHIADQFYWWKKLYSLWVATKPIPISELNRITLSEAIKIILFSTQFKKNVSKAAHYMKNEDGLSSIIDIINMIKKNIS